MEWGKGNNCGDRKSPTDFFPAFPLRASGDKRGLKLQVREK